MLSCQRSDLAMLEGPKGNGKIDCCGKSAHNRFALESILILLGHLLRCSSLPRWNDSVDSLNLLDFQV
jgi:hypothetical protein